MTKALNSAKLQVLLLVGIVCMVSVIFPRGVDAHVEAQVEALSFALSTELEEYLKSCSRIIDQEEHDVIQGFGHFETLPSPPHWQTYASPLATDKCRLFAYVELVGVGGQNILITPETVLAPVAQQDPGSCQHSHLNYGIFRQHLSFSFAGGSFLKWSYVGGGGLSGAWDGSHCVVTSDVNKHVDKYGKGPESLIVAGLIFGTDQVALEGDLTSIFFRTIVIIQAPSHFSDAGCGYHGCFHQVKFTVAPAPLAEYSIKVTTGMMKHSGTNAKVNLILYGAGMSAVKELSCRKDRCDRSDQDVTTFSSVELQDLTQLRLSSDDSGKEPGWYVREITVNNLTTGKTWFFPVERWLASDECAGELVLMLMRDQSPFAPGRGCRNSVAAGKP